MDQDRGSDAQDPGGRGLISDSHYGIRRFRSLRGVTFLSPNKKVTKEVGSVEALTVKPFGTFLRSFPRQPVFKPPSPEDPSRPPSFPGCWSGFIRWKVYREYGCN